VLDALSALLIQWFIDVHNDIQLGFAVIQFRNIHQALLVLGQLRYVE
jgi:hypothetical protein